jgi:tRNA A-37 threonylcarbamoyl transferase component Bud32
MDWVDGISLDAFVRANIKWNDRLAKLAAQFKTMMADLQSAGIAHGDLQHGNIMITRQGELRLVDYDGMFVPELDGLPSTELGHRNYQHPARDAQLFNPRMDNFSAWSIYASLIALSIDPSLAPDLEACDECLLFRQSDYRYPLNSKAFHLLESHESEDIRAISRTIRTLLGMPAEDIPFLSEEVKVAPDLPTVEPQQQDASVFEPPLAVRAKKPSATAQESDLDSRLMWPSLTEYMHALTNPQRNFIDPFMHNLILVRDHGMIRAKGTDHGAVFRYHYSDYEETRRPDILVKVFLHADQLIEHRYKQFYTFLHGGALNFDELRTHFTDFTFIADGLRVNDSYYPIVRMRRVKGPTLWEAVEMYRQDKVKMKEMIQKFVRMMALIESSGIIHGDIEPENIIVQEDHMVLVDYDLTTVPHGRALSSSIIGNRHYRHPKLPSGVPAPNDNFAAWMIYYSLKIIQRYPVIWNIAGAKPGRLLFHADDLKRPYSSHVFRMLKSHFSEDVRRLEAEVTELLNTPPDEIKPLRLRGYAMQVVESLADARAQTPALLGTGGSPWIIAAVLMPSSVFIALVLAAAHFAGPATLVLTVSAIVSFGFIAAGFVTEKKKP